MKKRLYRFLFKMAARAHTFFYLRCTSWAVKAEGGLHPKHRIMNYHRFFVDHLSPLDRVLDVGCGNGALTYDMAQKAQAVTAIDIIPGNVEKAQRNYGADNITYVVGDATTFQFTESFDVVTLSNVLEHIEDRVGFLKRLGRMTMKLIIRVPLITREWLPVYKKELGVDYRLDDTHFIEFTDEAFVREMDAAGLKAITYEKNFGEIWAVIEPK